MAKKEKAMEKLIPESAPFALTINLKHMREIPEIVCCNMLFTDEIVARVSSSAYECMWLMLAIAKASWNPIPMHTNIKLIVATYGNLK